MSLSSSTAATLSRLQALTNKSYTPQTALRGRFELSAPLMPRSTARHIDRASIAGSSYVPRTSRSASGTRNNSTMANGRTSYGGTSSYGTGSSNYGTTGTGTNYSSTSYSSGTSGLYSPRSSVNYGTTSYTPTSTYSYTGTSPTTGGYSSSYVPSHRTTSHSYYSSSAGASSTPLSPRSKSPVKEKEEKEEKKETSEDSASSEPAEYTSAARRRFRQRTTSKTDDSEPTGDVRLPSLNEQTAAASMSKDLRECLREEFLLCKICFDVFKSPKSLPCLHTFCLECLNKYMDGYRFDTRKFCCPICRRQVYMPKEGAEGFPDSFFVERLRDVLSRRTDDTDCHICNFRGQPCPAKVFCLECKTNLCNDCGNGHRENKVTAKHSLLILSEDATIKQTREHCCDKHSGEPVCFFCIECRRPICLACTVIDHAGHNVEAIQEVRQEFITECSNLIAKAETQLDDLTQKRTKLGHVEKEVCDKKDSVKADICQVADALIQQINKQKAALLSDLDKMFDFNTIQSERERMDSTIAVLQGAVDGGRKVLSRDLEPIEQLKAKGQTLTTLEESLHFEPYNVEVLSDRTQLAVQFFSGESEVRLGRLVRTVLPPEGSNSDPIIEYKTAEGTEATITTTGGAQTFIIKDDVRKLIKSIDSLAMLPSGELVVLSATSERRVQIFDMAGMLKCWFPQRSNKLAQPTSLCTWDNQIAVTDVASHAVHVFDHQGRLNHVFGAGVLDRPWAITATTNGNYVIADPGKTRLTIHTNNGDILNILHFQKKTAVPRFLATCGNTIYSVNQSGDDIKAWRFADSNLRLLGVIKVASAAAAAIPLASSSNLSSALASSASTTGSHQSLPVKQTSSVSSVSDNNTTDDSARSRSGSVSTTATPAPFACAGLFVDKEGNLFVTDRSTSSVAVFTALSETYMVQLSPSSPSRPSAIVVTSDDRIIVAQSKADETISGLVETLTGDALNMELVSYTLV